MACHSLISLTGPAPAIVATLLVAQGDDHVHLLRLAQELHHFPRGLDGIGKGGPRLAKQQALPWP
jgi:hypothetical protein